MNRKQFFATLGISAAAIEAISLLDSCSRDEQQQVNFTIDLTDPQYSDLLNIGGYKVINSSVIVAKDQNGNYVALSAICTHQQCTVEFQGFSNEFVCPCHQSHFDTNGGVTMGPATAPLTQYNVQLSGNFLHVYS